MLNLIQLLLINLQIPRMLSTLSKKELVHPLANVKKSQVPCLILYATRSLETIMNCFGMKRTSVESNFLLVSVR